MGRQHIQEGDIDEELRMQLETQIKDFAEEGYDADEIAEFLNEQGYDKGQYQPIMEEQGLDISEDNNDNDQVDQGLEAQWAEDYDGGYNDDSYDDGDF